MVRSGRMPPRRALFADERGAGLRVSWHHERDVVVLSLWRSDVCVGTFQLRPEEAERLGAFLAAHLNERDAAGARAAS